MRKLFLSVLGCFLSFSASRLHAECRELGTLEVEVEGMAAPRGLLFVALDKRAADFDQGALSEARYHGKFVAVTAQKMVLRFEDLPFGVYAVKAFHDDNKNLDLDKNLLGVPTENYGFSNKARGTFGPPTFKDASFELREAHKAIQIQLK